MKIILTALSFLFVASIVLWISIDVNDGWLTAGVASMALITLSAVFAVIRMDYRRHRGDAKGRQRLTLGSGCALLVGRVRRILF